MSESDSHRQVWERFTSGDENALLELYNLHYLGLINYGRRIVDDREFVNDCFMEMLIEFWNKRQSLPPVENVRSYLLTSFRRQILHRVEKEKRWEKKHSASQENSEQFQESYEEYIIKLHSDHHLKERITKALAKLTPRQAELIRLKFFDDLDYNEIAEQCGITKRTAYNIIADAIKQLKADLHGDQGHLFPLFLSLILTALQCLKCFQVSI
jgi:RNA polymerase sigma factor (sigma-70 family)